MKYGVRSIARTGLLALTAAALLGATAAYSNDDRIVQECFDNWDDNRQVGAYCHPMWLCNSPPPSNAMRLLTNVTGYRYSIGPM